MSGLFQGLEIGKRALLTHQLTMTTLGNNIANVSTPGYSRQRTIVTSAQPIELASYNVGNGVVAARIVQSRDLFLTSQYRNENKSLGQWAYREKALGQVETFFAEPNDGAMGDVLNKFWTSWQDLSNDPESSAARSAVVAQAGKLVDAFHTIDRQLSDLQASANQDVLGRINEINQTAKQVANLNRQIVSEELGGQKANDLRDQRDLLLDQLSNMVDVTTAERPNGSVSVYISGLAIVDNADTFGLGTKIVQTEDNNVRNEIIWQGTNTAIKITGGELKGLLDVRDKDVPKYQKQLDQLAAGIVTQVNAAHRVGTGLSGTGGLNFFNSSFTSAGQIQIENAIQDDPTLIAASQSGAPGDNANSLAIADLRNVKALAFGTSSITEFYNTMVSTLGVDSQEAITFKGNAEVLLQQIENSRQSVQGVSLDEEMADMVKMQHSYDAAAKLISYMDDALSTLINDVGSVQ
jgi:flagellar hook-associated protein 1